MHFGNLPLLFRTKILVFLILTSRCHLSQQDVRLLRHLCMPFVDINIIIISSASNKWLKTIPGNGRGGSHFSPNISLTSSKKKLNSRGLRLSPCFRPIQVNILGSKLWLILGIHSIFCNMVSRVARNLPEIPF